MNDTSLGQRTFDVAVVGAGVAGLAAALGAAQLGLRVALIGPDARSFAPTEGAPFDARIYALAPSAAKLLERLKVWPQLAAGRMQVVTRMRVFGDAGNELVFDAYRASLERLATIVEEGELTRVLAAACGFTPGIVRLRAAFARLSASADAAVIGLDDVTEVSARLIVGADGAQSAVRAAAGISATETPYRQTALVANFACERAPDGIAWQWFCDEGIVALLPLPENAVSLVWSAPEALAPALLQLAPDAFGARVTERTKGVLGALDLRGGVHAFPLRLIRIESLIGERVALVGDAAHVVHPLAGQGLNLGLRDVSDLLGVLAAREEYRDVGERVLLRRYERARAEPVGLMRIATDGLAQLFGADAGLLRQARNVGMSLVDRIAPLKNALIRHAVMR
jgi:ubiquinone biosynthesis UbiH/UbiF/VisC/COQ6 family hydroxylase